MALQMKKLFGDTRFDLDIYQRMQVLWIERWANILNADGIFQFSKRQMI
jgi:hypothetical protein